MGIFVPQLSVAETTTVYLTFLDEQLLTIPSIPSHVPVVAVGVLSVGVATATHTACADTGMDINDRHTSTSMPLSK